MVVVVEAESRKIVDPESRLSNERSLTRFNFRRQNKFWTAGGFDRLLVYHLLEHSPS